MIFVNDEGVQLTYEGAEWDVLEVNSPTVVRIGYDFATRNLDVVFKSGEASTYQEVEGRVFAHLVAATEKQLDGGNLDPVGGALRFLVMDRSDLYPKVVYQESREGVKISQVETYEFSLSDTDNTHLQNLEEKYNYIRLNTLLVACNDVSGFIVHGSGGIGKSYTVLETLNHHHYDFHLINTRMSGYSLVRTLRDNPRGLFVVEDMEGLMSDKVALAALRSALAGQSDKKGRTHRIVRYQTARENINFEFEGGVIFTGNRPLGDTPELEALKTRIPVFHFAPTREEILALGKKLSIQGVVLNGIKLTPRDCMEVYSYYQENLPQNRIPDLRTLFLGFKYFKGAVLGSVPWQSAFHTQIVQKKLAGTNITSSSILKVLQKRKAN